MATLRMPRIPFVGVLGWFKKDEARTVESARARDFARRVYKNTGGATPDLKRVYDSYLDNERRREEHRAR